MSLEYVCYEVIKVSLFRIWIIIEIRGLIWIIKACVCC